MYIFTQLNLPCPDAQGESSITIPDVGTDLIVYSLSDSCWKAVHLPPFDLNVCVSFSKYHLITIFTCAGL